MPCIGGHPLRSDLVIVSGIADGEVGYLSSASADGIKIGVARLDLASQTLTCTIKVLMGPADRSIIPLGSSHPTSVYPTSNYPIQLKATSTAICGG
jgi:hypothetical protein